MPGFPADQQQFMFWSLLSREPVGGPGLAGVYAAMPGESGRVWCNYPPGYVYVLRALAAVHDLLAPRDQQLRMESLDALLADPSGAAARRLYCLYKIPAVLADAATVGLLLIWLRRRVGLRMAAAAAGVYALIPAVVHNSAVWGQVDAVWTLAALASLEAAVGRRHVWMAVCAALALLIKPQAVVFAPLWAAALLRAGMDARCRVNPSHGDDSAGSFSRSSAGLSGRRRVATAIAAGAVTAAAVLLPFRSALGGVAQAYFGAAGHYPFTHLNGFSLWFAFHPMDKPHLEEMSTRYLSDAVGWDAPALSAGITPRNVGMLLVLGTWSWVFFRLLKNKCRPASLGWAARVLPLAFFMLATQMHERYLFPAIAAWAWACRPTPRWWAGWVVLAAASSINVLWAWPGPEGLPWTEALSAGLRRPWLGVMPGVWCAMSLTLLLATEVSDGGRRRNSANP